MRVRMRGAEAWVGWGGGVTVLLAEDVDVHGEGGQVGQPTLLSRFADVLNLCRGHQNILLLLVLQYNYY